MDGGEPLDLVDLDRAAVDRAIVGEVAECALGKIAKLVRLGLRLQRHQRRHHRAAYSEAEVEERRKGGARRLVVIDRDRDLRPRSEEHTSELQSLMRISYAVFCL